MTANETTCYLIEKTGESRQIFGPYKTVAAAEKAKGVRCAIVVGDGMSNGQTMTCGEVQAATQSGRIRTVDGSELS